MPGLHAHSEAEAILEQRLLFVSLCEAKTAGRVPGLHAHSEAKAILEQRLLFVSLCEARPPYKTMRNNSTNHSRGIIDSTRGRVPGLHAYSEAEAILEQRLLFVSLCEARMGFTRL